MEKVMERMSRPTLTTGQTLTRLPIWLGGISQVGRLWPCWLTDLSVPDDGFNNWEYEGRD
jgi:hypothetical protein